MSVDPGDMAEEINRLQAEVAALRAAGDRLADDAQEAFECMYDGWPNRPITQVLGESVSAWREWTKEKAR